MHKSHGIKKPNFLAATSVLGGKAKRYTEMDDLDRYKVGEHSIMDKEEAENVLSAGERVRAKRGFRSLFGSR